MICGPVLANCTVLVLYCLAFYKALSHRRKVTSTVSTTTQTITIANHTEVKLAVCGFTTFCIVLIYGILLIFTYKSIYDNNNAETTILQTIRGFLLDIYSSLNPYTLVIMSAKVREKFGELLHLRCATKSGRMQKELNMKEMTVTAMPRQRNLSRPNLALISTSVNDLPLPLNMPTRRLSDAYSKL